MNNEMMEKIQKEKEKMQRSIREAPKYFIKPEFISTSWGYEQIISKTAYLLKNVFVKKGRGNECVCNENDLVIYIETGKLHLLYSHNDIMENACEIVLSDGDAFKIATSMYYKFEALADVSSIFFTKLC